jgi:hypothetical protein
MDIKLFDTVTGWFPFRYGPNEAGETGKRRLGVVVSVQGSTVYVAPSHSDSHYRGHEWSIAIGPGDSTSAHKASAFVLDRVYAFDMAKLNKVGSLSRTHPGAACAIRWFIKHAPGVLGSAITGGKIEE